MKKEFKVVVNPFTKEVTISDKQFETVLFFEDLDEWQSFEFEGQEYDFHFYYDDKFSPSIYRVINNNTDTSEEGQQIINLEIRL